MFIRRNHRIPVSANKNRELEKTSLLPLQQEKKLEKQNINEFSWTHGEPRSKQNTILNTGDK